MFCLLLNLFTIFKVCLAQFNVAPSLRQQDLNVVDGQEVQKGDTVEMQYTGWLHAGNSFGKVKCS